MPVRQFVRQNATMRFPLSLMSSNAIIALRIVYRGILILMVMGHLIVIGNLILL
jgi:hypothetical protein